MSETAETGLWHRLKQRKLIQWVLAYAAFAWVLSQLLDSVSGTFGWPPFVMQAVWVLAGLGLIAAAVIAWYHGERGHQHVTATEIGMLFTLLVIAGGILSILRAQPGQPEPSLKAAVDTTSSAFLASVAVLPFDTYAKDEKDSYLGDAIAEEITAALGQVPTLKVISRTSTARFKNGESGMRAIADTLGVRHVVEGSIATEPGGDMMKVTVQLIDAMRDQHINSNTWVVAQKNLFEAQEQIANWVLDLLLKRVQSSVPAARSGSAAPSPAFQEFELGRAAAHKRTREGLLAAIEHLKRAIQIDSQFAPAHAQLASIYGLWGTYQYAGEPDSFRGYAIGLKHANQAIALDPMLAEAYAARGYLLGKSWAPAALAERDFQQALRLKPGSADAHSLYANFLARERRYKDAIEHAQKSITLDPLAPGREVGLAYAALAGREYSLTVMAARQALDRDPSLKLPKVLSAIALILSGRAADCDLIALESAPGVQAICMAALGKQTVADSIISHIKASAQNTTLPAQQLAIYYGWAGNTAETVRWTRESFKNSPNGLDSRWVVSGLFDRSLRDGALEKELATLRTSIWATVQAETSKL